MGGGGGEELGLRRESVVREQTIGHLQGGGIGRGFGQPEIDGVGGAVEADLGESEDLVEHRPGVRRCPGPAQAEGGTDAHRAGDGVAHQMPMEVPPGSVDAGDPISSRRFRISGQPICHRF